MEEWLPIPHFPEYEVSDLGRVRRVGKGKGAHLGRVLKSQRQNAGYQTVLLYRQNHGFGYLVHRLVAATFIGPCPPNHEVNHIDLDKTNNCRSNLEYVTRSANLKHGGRYRGVRNSQAKLDEATALIIRELHAGGGIGYKALGKRFGVSWSAIRNIVKRRTWA